MQDEYHLLLANYTWDLESLPADRKSIKCKWDFKLKLDANGEVQHYKARLCAKRSHNEKASTIHKHIAPSPNSILSDAY